MELGQRLKQARIEAGLSQRQLCGGEVTRNMLSQIENGSARPSMATLQYFAARLGKPVSFFLEEDTVSSPNRQRMLQARESCARQDWASVRQLLSGYEAPDPVYDPEKDLLMGLALLELARQALEEGRQPYGAQLLREADAALSGTLYYLPELRRRRLLLLARAKPEACGEIAAQLDTDDRELLLRARAALLRGDSGRSVELLDAAEDRTCREWTLLRGEAALALGDFEAAARYYHRVEEAAPEQAIPALERCYRELEDYKMAYYYACRQREKT